MSHPPRRWLDSPDAPPGAADLLRAAGSPDAAARTRMWAALAAAAPPPVAGATTGASRLAQLGAKATAALSKQVVVATFVAFGAVTTRAVTQHRAEVESARPTVSHTAVAARVARARVAVAPTVNTAPTPAPEALPVVTEAPTSAHEVATAPAVVVAARASAVRPAATHAMHTVVGVRPRGVTVPAPTLAEELDAITEARRALRDDPARALAVLDALAARSRGQGVMSHERERYTVEALRALGRTGEAMARAEAFLAAAPGSTAAGRVRALRDEIATTTNR